MKKAKNEVTVTLVGKSILILLSIKNCLVWILKQVPLLTVLACLICLTINLYKPRYIDRTKTVYQERTVFVYVDTPERIIYTQEVEKDMQTAILDVEYLAKCVQAEAGNQDRLGKAYVVDCVLNRFESGNYSNIKDVINAPGQFSCVKDGDIKVTPTSDIYDIIDEELKDRKNTEIKYFRTKHYHTFGTPCFQYGDHYFSK